MAASSNQKWEVYRCPVTGLIYDPFHVLASLHYYSRGKLNELTKNEQDPTTALKLATIGRKSFEVPPIDPKSGEGVPDAVVRAMMEKFAEYVRGKGDGAGTWHVYAQPSTASLPSSAPRNCSGCL